MGITRIELDNFRSFPSFSQCVPEQRSAQFSKGINLFIGPNGSGKTSLLNAIGLLFGRGQGNSQGTMGPGFATDCSSVAEHHDKDKPFTLAAYFDYGTDDLKGRVRIHHEQGRNAERLLNGTAVEWDVDQSPLLQRLYDRCFPVGWPRQIWKLGQRSFKSMKGQSQRFYKGAWERIQDACECAIGTRLGNPQQLVTRCKVACPLCGVARKRNVVGDHFIDINNVPLMHGSDGQAHFAYLALEIEKHSNPSTFLLEEPDVFMHASLQKKLLEYLARRHRDVGHQFFLTTHSPYLMDLGSRIATQRHPINAYRMTYRDGTRVESQSASSMWAVLQDLGHRPSDVMHPNGVIWVEGPSDVLYLDLWLSKFAQGGEPLIRGFHYDILTYGGSNIAHIDYDPRFKVHVSKKLINVASIHRNSIILMDKDSGLNDGGKGFRKSEVLKAFGDSRGFLTGPRCIEGYIAQTIRRQYPMPKNLKGHWKKVDIARRYIRREGRRPLASIVDDKNTDVIALLSSILGAVRSWNA